MRANRKPFFLLMVAMLAAGSGGCSVKKFAINKLGDSLANPGTAFSGDNDPEFVGQAVPFSLKLIESLLEQSPNHRGLLFAASSGYAQYSYVWIQQLAEQLENDDLPKSRAESARATNLYLRARDFGMRGLEVKHKGFAAALRDNPKTAVQSTKVADVPLLYWTAVSWGAAIALSKDNPALVADQPQVEALIDRAYALEPDYEHGAIDQFLINYESARQGVKGDYAERCKMHFDRAVSLSKGELAGPYVAYAESVSLSKNDRAEFDEMLKKALAVNPDSRVEWRLNNVVMQRRAKWLMSREDDLFLEPLPPGETK
jgi:predicted anti-sigma-YlaC factor YlaD